jgi:hypothetical protein
MWLPNYPFEVVLLEVTQARFHHSKVLPQEETGFYTLFGGVNLEAFSYVIEVKL